MRTLVRFLQLLSLTIAWIGAYFLYRAYKRIGRDVPLWQKWVYTIFFATVLLLTFDNGVRYFFQRGAGPCLFRSHMIEWWTRVLLDVFRVLLFGALGTASLVIVGTKLWHVQENTKRQDKALVSKRMWKNAQVVIMSIILLSWSMGAFWAGALLLIEIYHLFQKLPTCLP